MHRFLSLCLVAFLLACVLSPTPGGRKGRRLSSPGANQLPPSEGTDSSERTRPRPTWSRSWQPSACSPSYASQCGKTCSGLSPLDFRVAAFARTRVFPYSGEYGYPNPRVDKAVGMRCLMLTVAAVTAFLEVFVPLDARLRGTTSACCWATATGPYRAIMTCLTVTPESRRRGRAGQGRPHRHPSSDPFQSGQAADGRHQRGADAAALTRAGVAVYSPHSAFDNTRGGINDLLARKLDLIEVGPLRPGSGPRQVKLVVFVPEATWPGFHDALFAAGAGRIGHYSECSFRLPRDRHVLRLGSLQPDRRPEGPARGCQRMAARSRLPGRPGRGRADGTTTARLL